MNLTKIGLLTLSKVFKPEIVKATLALTWRCNHKCASCLIWCNNTVKNELTTDEVQKFIENNNLMWLAFTGGEAFLRKDIAEIMHMSLQKYPSVSITSNGSQPEKIEKSVKYALKNTQGILTVNMSLDGNQEQHDSFTRVQGSFERVTESFDRLIALKNKRLSLVIDNLVSPITDAGREFVLRYAEEKDLKVVYTIEMRSDAFYHNNEMPVPEIKLPETKLDLRNPFNYLYIRQAKRGKKVRCVAGQYDCAITPEGKVKPCLFVDKVAYNLRDTNYKIKPLECNKTVEKCYQNGSCWTPCTAYTTMMFRLNRIIF